MYRICNLSNSVQSYTLAEAGVVQPTSILISFDSNHSCQGSLVGTRVYPGFKVLLITERKLACKALQWQPPRLLYCVN